MMGSLVGCFLIALVLFCLAIFIQNVVFAEICSGIILVIFVYLLLRAWYIKVYIRRYFYSASDDFITIKKGVFAPAEIHVQYPKIQDVYVDQDILDRIMGLYDVHIASATVTSGIEAHIDGVEEAAADGLKLFLLDKIRGGGRSGAAQGSAVPSSQTVPDVPKPLDAGQMISSEQYPIGSRWMGMQVITALFHAFWISAAIAVYVNGQPATGWSLNWTLGFIVFTIMFLCLVIYSIVWKSNFHFAFLPDYIQLSTQVLAKSEQHMPYRTVQDVVVRQGILERMFGLATVFIQNAASISVPRSGGRGAIASQAMNIPGQTLEGANKIAEIVRSVSLTRNSTGTGL